MSFVYSHDSHTELAKFLTSERLTAYLIATKGDVGAAIRLYERNTRLSEHLYGVLQACEVAVRNSIHINLSAGLGRTDWYDSFKFGRREMLMIGDAKLNVQRFKSKVLPGQIVAELTMGFWIRLLAPEYEKSLWVKHLHKSFSHYRKPNRVLIFARLDEIRRLRNRVAHHEPIFKKDHLREYAKIIEAIRWICPSTAAWVDSSSSFPRYVKSLV
jgi:Abi-like protein